MLSRLLYPNPVCLLSTWRESAGNDLDVVPPTQPSRNIMTISWLTPLNNHASRLLPLSLGLFICSMNSGRYSRTLVQANRRFILSVITDGMQDLTVQIGSCTGGSLADGIDKFEHLGIQVCRPGGAESHGHSGAAVPSAEQGSRRRPRQGRAQDPLSTVAALPAVAVRGCASHIACTVVDETEWDGHAVMTCRMDAAWADERYWNGKQFIQTDSSVPALLTFLGTKRFARMVPE
nr:hypothetical protein HK105_006433 [Polyrhizophydium stewartii]